MFSKLSWVSQMQFKSDTRGHENILDATLQSGGLNKGPNPKEYVLQGIAGCTAMDVVFYLNKYKEVPLSFDVEIDADLTEKTMPTYFKEVRLKYVLLGDQLSKDKVISAVEKSMTKYCGVSFMISKVAPIKYDVFLNGEKIFSGQAKFE